MKKYLTKNNITNGSVLLIITLIIIGFLVFKKDKTSEITEPENNSIGTTEDQGLLENKNEGNIITPVSSFDKEKFNLAMNNAQKAYVNKEYAQAINYYNEALTYKASDKVYTGLTLVYSSLNNWAKALESINLAIKINPLPPDYWNWKLDLMDEKTDSSYQDLKKVYNEGLYKVDQKTKVNLVTHFTIIAENNNEIQEAINIWKYAIELYPKNKTIYQAEIDRLQASS
jgi:tetratricopeptide (TPR) repeat protein